VLYALAELSKDLPEHHPTDRMEAAFTIEASICVCFQGGYRDVGTMSIWSDPFWSRLPKLLRGLPGRGLDLTNATDCSSKSVDLLVTTQTSMCTSTWTETV